MILHNISCLGVFGIANRYN